MIYFNKTSGTEPMFSVIWNTRFSKKPGVPRKLHGCCFPVTCWSGPRALLEFPSTKQTEQSLKSVFSLVAKLWLENVFYKPTDRVYKLPVGQSPSLDETLKCFCLTTICLYVPFSVLKGMCHENFDLNFFHDSNLSGPLINRIHKYLSLFIRCLDGFESWKIEVEKLVTYSL